MMTELIIALLAHMPENRIIQGGRINTATTHREIKKGQLTEG